MANPNLDRSKRHEREIVNRAEDAGLFAERAYASNGQSLGETEETDVLLQGPGRHVRIQAKRRKNIAQYLTCENVDAVVVREDRSENLVVLPLDDFLDLLRDAKRQHG